MNRRAFLKGGMAALAALALPKATIEDVEKIEKQTAEIEAAPVCLDNLICKIELDTSAIDGYYAMTSKHRYLLDPYPPIDSFGISSSKVREHIHELTATGECETREAAFMRAITEGA